MKWWSPAFSLLVFVALCFFPAPADAQSAEAAVKAAPAPRYDIAREVTLVGTLNAVVTKTTPEMNMLGGSHLIIETAAGKIDASLGAYRMTGNDALAPEHGSRIQVTGVMSAIRGQQVFVTRLVVAGNRVYKIRNEHGFVISPVARQGNTPHARNSDSQSTGGQL